jgi:hypothetical protein
MTPRRCDPVPLLIMAAVFAVAAALAVLYWRGGL